MSDLPELHLLAYALKALVRVGRIDLPSHIPRLTETETLRFSQILASAFEHTSKERSS